MRAMASRVGFAVVLLTSFRVQAAEPATGSSASAPAGDEKSASAPATPPPVEVKKVAPVDLHGGVYLWYYQPLEGDAKADVSVYFANLVLESAIGHFGVHVEPRFRDTKLRPFFASNVWVQEAYGFYREELATVKVGKVYNRFGKFWDNSFYGNLLYFDGLKLAPDEGISIEGAVAPTDGHPFGFSYAAQFFVADGRTNGALQGRDTISYANSRRRNIGVVRLEPQIAFAKDGAITVGLNATRFDADLGSDTDPAVARHHVARLSSDVTLGYRGFSLYGEFAAQKGQSVSAYPIAATPPTATTPGAPGRASDNIDYVLGGVEATAGPLSGRVNVSYVRYGGLDVSETLYEPGVGVTLSDNLSVLLEYVHWRRKSASLTLPQDQSLNLVLWGHF